MKKVCCFAGHSDIYYTGEHYKSLSEKIENLIINENVTEFRVGNYGAFDSLCSKAVRELREKYTYINLILVIPYLTSEIIKNKEYYENSYDTILVAEIPENTPQKLKIIKCNEFIVNTSDYLIYYVINHCTGADRTLEYAKKKELKTISI